MQVLLLHSYYSNYFAGKIDVSLELLRFIVLPVLLPGTILKYAVLLFIEVFTKPCGLAVLLGFASTRLLSSVV